MWFQTATLEDGVKSQRYHLNMGINGAYFSFSPRKHSKCCTRFLIWQLEGEKTGSSFISTALCVWMSDGQFQKVTETVQRCQSLIWRHKDVVEGGSALFDHLTSSSEETYWQLQSRFSTFVSCPGYNEDVKNCDWTNETETTLYWLTYIITATDACVTCWFRYLCSTQNGCGGPLRLHMYEKQIFVSDHD